MESAVLGDRLDQPEREVHQDQPDRRVQLEIVVKGDQQVPLDLLVTAEKEAHQDPQVALGQRDPAVNLELVVKLVLLGNLEAEGLLVCVAQVEKEAHLGQPVQLVQQGLQVQRVKEVHAVNKERWARLADLELLDHLGRLGLRVNEDHQDRQARLDHQEKGDILVNQVFQDRKEVQAYRDQVE